VDIKTFVSAARSLPANHSILIHGETGIGKSQIMRFLATGFSLDTIDKRLSQQTEGDLVGLPVIVDGTTRFAHPDWYVEACKRPVMLFFDELNRATPEVMQAAFQIVLDRELNGMRLHPETRIVAAVNMSSRYQVNEIDPALFDRFWVVALEPSVDDWLDWAKMPSDHDPKVSIIHPIVQGYIQTNKTMLDPPGRSEPNVKHSSRRSWQRCNDALMMNGLLDVDLKKDASALAKFYNICLGYLGLEVSQSFVSYASNLERQLSATDILDRFDENLHRIQDLGVDKWNICIAKMVEYAKENKFTDTQAKNVGKFFKLIPGELCVFAWTQFATDNTPHGIGNVKAIHPHVVAEILKNFPQSKS
jgi:hypothetical protein